MNLFIAGTDTAVGKTHTTALIVQELRASGIDAVAYKPIVCGDRNDAHILSAASGDIAIDEVNPLWLHTPAAPWVAAQLENRVIDPAPLLDAYHHLASRHQVVIVEGCGGWDVPITATYSMAHLARDLALPVVLVVANRLGAINHSLLTAKAIRSTPLPLRGLIFNHLVDELDTATIANKQTIPALCESPLLAEIIYGQDWLDVDWLHTGNGFPS